MCGFHETTINIVWLHQKSILNDYRKPAYDDKTKYRSPLLIAVLLQLVFDM